MAGASLTCGATEPFNVGTSVETKIRDLAEMVSEAVGYGGETTWDASRPDGQPVRFTHEPDLWRIHIRTIRGLLTSIDSITQVVDRAAATLRRASLLFLAGLLGVAIALGILILEVTFR